MPIDAGDGDLCYGDSLIGYGISCCDTEGFSAVSTEYGIE